LNYTLTRNLDRRITVFGSIRPDAVLTAAPTAAERKATGRRRRRGKLLPKPEKLFHSTRYPWQSCERWSQHVAQQRLLAAQVVAACDGCGMQ
jgi:hypothetical protein